MHPRTRHGMSVYAGPEATSAVKPAERGFGTAGGPELRTSGSGSAKPSLAAWSIRADRSGKPPLAAGGRTLALCRAEQVLRGAVGRMRAGAVGC